MTALTTTRRLLLIALHVAFLLVAFVDSQNEDNQGLPGDSGNFPVNYDEVGNDGGEVEHVDVEDRFADEDNAPDYVDNRIDATPTFVSPVEKFIKAIVAPLGWISHATGGGGGSESSSGVGRLISGLTKPIRNVVSPVGRAVRGGFGDVLNLIGDRFKAVYPGTEWCGAGNTARNSEEVGLFKITDRCCRSHDQCNVNLEAGSTDYGLRNNGIYTRSHCSCDAKFYHCLKDAHTIVAANIGVTYFNVLRPQCFKEEYPAHCIRYGRTRLVNNKCLEYDYDFNQNVTWQWFDTPDFL